MVEQGTITEDEAALYDRQIRLWGLDAQKRLRASRVLLIGVRGLGAEVAKNIVLAGIKSLTILDHTEVTEEDTCSQFLIPRSEIGKNRAESSLQRTQQLNPMVDVRADTDDVAIKPDEFFKQFNVVCATCCSEKLLTKINQICFDNRIKFFAGDVFGYHGYMFSDLGDHEYAEEVKKEQKKDKSQGTNEDGEPAAKKQKVEEEETVIVKKYTSFSRLKSAFDIDWSEETYSRKLKRTPSTYFLTKVVLNFMNKKDRRPTVSNAESDIEDLKSLRESTLQELKVPLTVIPDDFACHCFAELSPVCAVVGGILGQEVIKAVSHKDKPHNNFFFYNGVEGSGLVDKIGVS